MMMGMNAEHRMSNVERRTLARPRFIGSSAFDVQRSMFLLALFLCLASPLCGQTNSEATNALPKLSPPYAELPPTFWEQHGTMLWFVGIGIFLLAGLVVWLCLRPKPKAILPPAVQARNALEGLLNSDENGARLSKVSQILRHYFIAAFQLPPGELTTAEFCRVIASCEQVGGQLAATVSDFLHRCDEQKFSPAKSAAALGAVNQALALIESAEARRAQTEVPTRA